MGKCSKLDVNEATGLDAVMSFLLWLFVFCVKMCVAQDTQGRLVCANNKLEAMRQDTA
jgi:hypothetical protein